LSAKNRETCPRLGETQEVRNSCSVEWEGGTERKWWGWWGCGGGGWGEETRTTRLTDAKPVNNHSLWTSDYNKKRTERERFHELDLKVFAVEKTPRNERYSFDVSIKRGKGKAAGGRGRARRDEEKKSKRLRDIGVVDRVKSKAR